MSIGDEFREANQRLLEFVNTATAEEGWCYMCGDLAADIEAPALTRLRAECVLLTQALWDTWAALGHDTDGDTGPGALIAGMGLDGFAAMVVKDAATFREESERDYDNDISALEVERDEWKRRAEAAEARLAAFEYPPVAVTE